MRRLCEAYIFSQRLALHDAIFSITHCETESNTLLLSQWQIEETSISADTSIIIYLVAPSHTDRRLACNCLF